MHFDDPKYQLFANKMIKILVVLVTKIVPLFKQIQHLGINIGIIIQIKYLFIYLFDFYQFR